MFYKGKKLDLATLIRLLVRHWQWFLLSVFICLCAAQLYCLYVTPVYEISARMLVKRPDNYSGRASNRFLRYTQHVGLVNNTSGVENEVEKIWSSVLIRDVVTQLKLYTDYRVKGRLKSHAVYATQPVSIDLDQLHLDSMDRSAYDEFRTFNISLMRQSRRDSSFVAGGYLDCNGEAEWAFRKKVRSLPDTIRTPYGTLTLTRNPHGQPLEAGQEWLVTVSPPLYKAINYMSRLSVTTEKADGSSIRWIRRFLLKLSAIATMTLRDQDRRRGIDFMNQIAISYNRLANRDKNDIALRTEAFINARISQLSQELHGQDLAIEGIKRQSGLTTLTDVAQSVRLADDYSSKLTVNASLAMMIDMLTDYVSKPENRYALIPTDVGLMKGEAEQTIRAYNTIIQHRNRLLMGASEEAPQVRQASATADEMRQAVTTALRQARHAIAINRRSDGSQYAGYRDKISSAPGAERGLVDEGREQRVKARLLKLLLQKREENSIKLQATADHGRLIDEPIVTGRVKPRVLVVHAIALAVGLAVPYAVFILAGALRFRVRSRRDLQALTAYPVIAEVPLTTGLDRGRQGIVVRTGATDSVTDVFHLMRTNIGFMMTGDRQTVLFTSATSGEGKTFCAANLAVSYASVGRRVVLCGVDIRKPAIGRLFGVEDKRKGLSTLLTKGAVTAEEVEAQIVPSGIDGRMDLLLAGPVPPNPTELLARDSFGQVLAVLKARYDYVILDSAPVGLVTDTLQITRWADVTVMVCRLGYTPLYGVRQICTLAKDYGMPNPCLVLNGVEQV